MTTLHASAETVRAQILSILTAWGMPRAPAGITADVMVETDLWGVDSHGISMLMMYEDMLRAGRLNLAAEPSVVFDTAAMARIDGQAGLGHPVASMGMDAAIEKARATGIGVVTAFNSHHFGAAGVYAIRAAEAGCIGLVTSTSRTVAVVPTFAAEPVLGTNPIAFAAPGRNNRPFLLDMATSAVALNKVKVYGFHGKELPRGWVADGQGRPITDPERALSMCREGSEGGLSPVGGTRAMGSHKGYGLGVMAQLLAGALAGGSFSPVRDRSLADDAPFNIGHFFLAMDPRFFRADGEFEMEVDEVIDLLRATRPADPAQPVLVAGDPEAYTREHRLRDGIPIPPPLAANLHEICTRARVDYLLGVGPR